MTSGAFVPVLITSITTGLADSSTVSGVVRVAVVVPTIAGKMVAGLVGSGGTGYTSRPAT